MAKKRARAIDYSRGKDTKRQLYRELIAATRATQAALQQAAERLANVAGMAAERWRAQVSHYLPLIERILAQSQRRVLEGLAVPAGEKLVSLFEPHADIIVKGGRDVQYGHKLNLITGKSGLAILRAIASGGGIADHDDDSMRTLGSEAPPTVTWPTRCNKPTALTSCFSTVPRRSAR